MRIVLTGGGSGGHVSPMLAVADALRRDHPDLRLLYIGVRSGLEARLVPAADIPIRFAPSKGMPSGKSPALLGFAFTVLAGVLVASWHLVRFRPKVIVASGGYASAPAVFASALLRTVTFGLWRIPVYIHEQNAVPGRMNTAAARIARQMGVVHPASLPRLPNPAVETVGYPVRAGFQQVDRAVARARLGLQDGDQYVVITGGSQGARTINRAVIDALPHLAGRPRLHIIHAAGTMRARGYHALDDTRARLAALPADQRPENYTLLEYLDEMPLHLAAADLAVIRAGAGSLVEVCTQGVPALVIPKANLPGDSQVANARELAAKGAVELIYEESALHDGRLVEEVPGEVLATRMIALLDDPARRQALVEAEARVFDRRAADRIAKRVIALGRSLQELELDTAPAVESGAAEALPPLPTDLRRWVERTMGIRYERAFDHGPVRDWQLDRLPDLPYLRYRGAALLTHPSWQLQNEGVKLIGLTRHRDRLDLLLHILTDRRPAPRVHRWLGGDFRYVGFVRRNTLNALALLGVVNAEVRAALATALDDPYYEVRAATLRLIRSFIYSGRKLAGDPALAEGIRRRTRDRNIEVRWEALDTFGHVGEPEDVLAVNRGYALEEKAPLREAVLRSYHALLDRYPAKDGAVPAWREAMIADLDEFTITSLAFHPHFPLKERYVSLRNRIREESPS